MYLAGIQEHGSLPVRARIESDQIIGHAGVVRKDFLQQYSQFWNVPLSAADVVQQTIFGRLRRQAEQRIEGRIGRLYPQFGIEYDQRMSYCFDDSLGIQAGCVRDLLGSLAIGDVYEGDHDAIDAIVGGAIWQDAPDIATDIRVGHPEYFVRVGLFAVERCVYSTGPDFSFDRDQFVQRHTAIVQQTGHPMTFVTNQRWAVRCPFPAS